MLRLWSYHSLNAPKNLLVQGSTSLITFAFSFAMHGIWQMKEINQEMFTWPRTVLQQRNACIGYALKRLKGQCHGLTTKLSNFKILVFFFVLNHPRQVYLELIPCITQDIDFQVCCFDVNKISCFAGCTCMCVFWATWL